MDVKFILKAECRLEDIDHKAGSNTEVAKELEKLFEDIGIKAVVDVSGLTYINEAEGEKPYRTKYEVGEEHPVAYEIETEGER